MTREEMANQVRSGTGGRQSKNRNELNPEETLSMENEFDKKISRRHEKIRCSAKA